MAMAADIRARGGRGGFWCLAGKDRELPHLSLFQEADAQHPTMHQRPQRLMGVVVSRAAGVSLGRVRSIGKTSQP